MNKPINISKWVKRGFIPIALSSALFLGGCGSRKADNTSQQADQSSFRPDTAAVETAQVQPHDFNRSIQSTGTLVAKRHAQLRSLAAGKITAVTVDIGDFVKKGAVLMQIRQIDYKLALEQAKANLSRAQAQYDNAGQDYNRIKNLYEAGSATAQQRDQSQSVYEEAGAQLKQAQAAVDDAQQKLDDTTIRAPYSGFITKRYLMSGEYAHVGDPAFDITDLSVLEAEMDLPEEYAGSVPRGLKVDIDFLSNFNTVPGIVTNVNPSINTSTRTFTIKVQVKNPDYTLPDGLFCTGTFNLPTLKNKPAVPKDALDEQEGQSIVWVIKDGKAHQQQVTEGVTDGNWVMIDKGVKIGDTVAISGTSILIDGYPVRIKKNTETAMR